MKAISFLMRLLPGFFILTSAIAVVVFVSMQSSEVSASRPIVIPGSADFTSTSIKDFLPDTPAVFSPANKLVVSGQSVMFAWHATGADDNYELMYSWNSDFESAQSVLVKDSVYSLSFTEVGSQPLYWKIRTVTADKAYSQWTSVHSITFQPVVNVWRCDHNCAQCPNPCGRSAPVR
ncbi:hypothetical protein DSECCO2_549290 [anaerobic digester metagenome]